MTHADVETVLRDVGWQWCGAGDWAIGLRCPGGCHAARITPFDPASPFTARLYREAARTGACLGSTPPSTSRAADTSW